MTTGITIPPLALYMNHFYYVDVGGFFWNELMCIATAVFLIAGSFGQYRQG